jgi:hypothetical protein
MDLEWCYQYPLSLMLLWLGLIIYIMHTLFERFYFLKSLRRLIKLNPPWLSQVKQNRAVACINGTSSQWILALVFFIFLANTFLFYGLTKGLGLLYVMEFTPVKMGKILGVKQIKRRGSKGSVYYVYDHLVEYEGKEQIINSRKRYSKREEFPFHESPLHAGEWVEHYNKNIIIMMGITTPLGIFSLYMLLFSILLGWATRQAKESGSPAISVEVLAADRYRIKNGEMITYWFIYQDILYTLNLNNIKRNERDEYMNFKGKELNLQKAEIKLPWFNPWRFLEFTGVNGRRRKGNYLVYTGLK